MIDDLARALRRTPSSSACGTCPARGTPCRTGSGGRASGWRRSWGPSGRTRCGGNGGLQGRARRQSLALAAERLEASEADLEIVEGAVRVRGVPSRAVALADLARMTSGFGAAHAPVFGVASEAIVQRAPAFGAHVARVEVDAECGRVRVAEYAVAQDVGRAINPAAIRGQVHGGVAQGIGWALYERMAYDAEGTLLTATFA